MGIFSGNKRGRTYTPKEQARREVVGQVREAVSGVVRSLFGGMAKPKETPRWRKTPPKPADDPGNRGTGSSETLTQDFVDDFVYGNTPFFVESSNVESAQYSIDREELTVRFHGGRGDLREYIYADVSPEEAAEFVRAGSKGVWVWDNLRVRGSQTAHQKDYHQIAGKRPG